MIYALAVLIGLSLGLLGGGGSVLAVPVMIYGAGLPAKEAIASSLVVVGASSLLGALAGFRQRSLDLATVAHFSLWGMLGTYGGSQLAGWLSGATQLRMFGVVMLIVAGLMLKQRQVSATPVAFPVPLAIPALFVGLLTGLVGVGGGFLIVPTLVLAAHLPMHRAVPTSLAVIAFNSAAGLVGYLGQVALRPLFLAPFTLAVLAGTLLGTRVARHVSAAHLQKAFAGLLLAVGIGILIHGGPL